ncbi:MAG TPA: glycosyltransferase family 39 protein [Chloroflexia bacterium]|nr:glycosyltransferase family 39 protein [Chloroflexia bacterium]
MEVERSGWLAGRRRGAMVVVLVGLALAAFLPGVGGYFLSDDWVLLDWTRASTPGDVAAFFDPNTFWFYRPLLKVYYWAGQSVFGLRAAPFHIVSLLLHGLNGYLLYRLAAPHAGWRAGLAAALVFMLVPYHAETVSWIAATGDLVAVTCTLGSLLALRRYLADGGARWAALGGGLFAVGLFTRETTIMLPALALLAMLTMFPMRGRLSARWLGPVAVAYGLALGAYLLVLGVGRQDGSGVERGGLSFRALNVDSVLLGVFDYVHGLVPGGQAVAGLPLDTLRVVVWVEAALVVVLAVALWRARMRTALLGLGWLLVTPLVFVFLSPPAPRYFYMPSVGYGILVGALLGAALAIGLAPGRERAYRAARWATALAALALVAWQVGGLLERENAWRAAGQASGGVWNDTRTAVPEPEDYAAFFYVDLPGAMGVVPAFGNGVQQAVQRLYDNRTITAERTTCADLLARPEMPRYSYIFRFKGDGVSPMEREDCIR